MDLKKQKDEPRVRRIEAIRKESSNVKTFRLFDPPSGRSDPGQFAMVWVPGVGEIPLSFSFTEGNLVEFTVNKVGLVTEEIHDLEPGDRIGIRGPYGNGFSPPSGNCILVGGGCGIIPLRHYFHYYEDHSNIEVVYGANSDEDLIFMDELVPVRPATDDGSLGYRGPVTELFNNMLEDREPNIVLSAGPEPMLYDMFRICREKEIYFQASLERVMKCGVGVCGSCLIDDFRVCKDGPVADSRKLASLKEFGKWKRTKSGARDDV